MNELLPERGAETPPEGDRSEWLVTFSDLVLQLFAFVIVAVVLEAGSASVTEPTAIAAKRPLPPEQTRSASVWALPIFDGRGAPSAARQVEPEPPETVPEVAPEPVVDAAIEPVPEIAIEPIPEARLVSLGRYFEHLLTAGGIDDAAQVQVRDGAVVVSLGETVAFAPGSDQVPAAGRAVLGEIASVAAGMPELGIQVSGHTDDRPIRTARFPSNLHLSLARAAQVAGHLTALDEGLRTRVFATGYGAERPVAGNDTPDGRAENRRVEVRLVPLESTSLR